MSEYIISSGITSTGVIVQKNDTMTVLPGGTANSTMVAHNTGSMFVSSGGTANSTTVYNSGGLFVDGGVVNYTRVTNI